MPPVGLKLATVGGTFSFFRVPTGPVFVLTETSPVMAAGGTTAVMKSSLMTLKLVARSELDCGCSGESVAQDIDRPRRRSRIVLHDDEPRVRCAAQGVEPPPAPPPCEETPYSVPSVRWPSGTQLLQPSVAHVRSRGLVNVPVFVIL